MTGKLPPLVIVGHLPPAPGPAASMTALLAHALKSEFDVTCVLPDLVATPAGLDGLAVRRVRDLRFGGEAFLSAPRLYCLGGGPEDLPILEMLWQAPGVVLPAATSFFDLAKPWFITRGTWPQGYIDWVSQTCGEAGRALLRTELLRYRSAPAIHHDLDFVGLFLEPATAVVAPGPWAAARLAAGGIDVALTLDAPPAPNFTPASGTPESQTVRIVCDGLSPDAQQALRLELSNIGPRAIEIRPLDGTWSLLDQVISADVVLCADGPDYLHPLAACALAQGKRVVVADSVGCAHINSPRLFRIKNPACGHDIATHVAAAAFLPDSEVPVQAAPDAALKALANLLKQTPVAPIPVVPEDAPQTKPKAKATGGVGATPGRAPHGPVALIGNLPPEVILQAALPQADLRRSPRFATPSVAALLAERLAQPVELALKNLGYEATIIDDGDPTPHGFARPPKSWAEVQPYLKHAKTALGFCLHGPVDGIYDGDSVLAAGLARRIVKPTIPLKLQQRPRRRKTLEEGTIAPANMFWRYAPSRTAIRMVIMTGVTDRILLGAVKTMPDCMVAGPTSTVRLAGGDKVVLEPDALGILEFDIAALSPKTGFLASVTETHDFLAQHGLYLEWCSHD